MIEQFKDILDVLEIKAQTKTIEHPEDGDLRRFKDRYLFVITLFCIAISILVWSFFILFRPESPHFSLVLNGGFGLVMALAGYYVRGK